MALSCRGNSHGCRSDDSRGSTDDHAAHCHGLRPAREACRGATRRSRKRSDPTKNLEPIAYSARALPCQNEILVPGLGPWLRQANLWRRAAVYFRRPSPARPLRRGCPGPSRVGYSGARPSFPSAYPVSQLSRSMIITDPQYREVGRSNNKILLSVDHM